ncbi:MAG: ornithine carbamoyltransferase [Spirochaetes bacterium]|nr:ornithine carbamoyltransferase [Spirochaetota bacterium]
MKIPRLTTKDLLSITDLSRDEILQLFRLAARLKADLKMGRNHDLLKKKSLAMIFEKSSTRTRVSFETGVTQLGGHALFLSGNDIQIGRGETIQDTAKVLSRYVDCIMIRTFAQQTVVDLAENSRIPVINGLTDLFHPCQALADFFTVYERGDDLGSIKFTYIGDGNNVANSLIQCAAILGMRMTVLGPSEFKPPSDIVNEAMRLAGESGAEIVISSDIDKDLAGTDYLYTDVWISMGQENDPTVQQKKALLSPYKITMPLLQKCGNGCQVMHCLPAHRGEEIDDSVLDSERSIVYEQAENRMHIQKAIMCALMR